MPLQYDDEPDSWGRAAKHWPTFVARDEAHAERAFVACSKERVIPYGSYVRDGLGIRCETPELLDRLTRHMHTARVEDTGEIVRRVNAAEDAARAAPPGPNQPGHEANTYAEKYFTAESIERIADFNKEPIDMVLHCPACGLQHIDRPGADVDANGPCYDHHWNNPPHRSHLCFRCGHVWRPADVPTNGVAVTKTKGKDDSPVGTAQAEPIVWPRSKSVKRRDDMIALKVNGEAP